MINFARVTQFHNWWSLVECLTGYRSLWTKTTTTKPKCICTGRQPGKNRIRWKITDKVMRETKYINMTINCSFEIAVKLMIVITDNQTINKKKKKNQATWERISKHLIYTCDWTKRSQAPLKIPWRDMEDFSKFQRSEKIMFSWYSLVVYSIFWEFLWRERFSASEQFSNSL